MHGRSEKEGLMEREGLIKRQQAVEKHPSGTGVEGNLSGAA